MLHTGCYVICIFEDISLLEITERREPVDIAQLIAIERGIRTCLFVPYSMNQAATGRILSIRTGIEFGQIWGGEFQSSDWPVICKESERILNAPLLINDSKDVLVDIRQTLLGCKEQHDIKMGVVDLAGAALSFEEKTKHREDLERLSKDPSVAAVVVCWGSNNVKLSGKEFECFPGANS